MDFSKIKKRQVMSPPLVVIYGGPGIGKTAFGIGADKSSNYKVGRENHLLVNIDFRGADRLECVRATDLTGSPIESIDDIRGIFGSLATQDHDFNWIIFDDLTTLEELFVREVCMENKVENLQKVEYGKGYALARVKWHLFFAMIKELQAEKPLGVMLIGHTKVDNMKDPMSESFSRHDLLLDKQSKEIIKKSVDLIGFAHKKVKTLQKDAGFGKKELTAVGKSERVITFAPDIDGFESKDRFNMPEEIALDWSIFEAELSQTMAVKETPHEKLKKSI